MLIAHRQWKATYNCIREYRTNGSGGHWDDDKGANIDKKDPAAEEFWNGYMKSNVRSFFILLAITFNSPSFSYSFANH